MPMEKPKPLNETERYRAEMGRAEAWIAARGGAKQVAEDILLVSLSANPRRVRDALEKAGAPGVVFVKIWRELVFQAARKEKP